MLLLQVMAGREANPAVVAIANRISKNGGGSLMLVKIEAYHDGQFWCARGIGEDIFTQSETFDELIENIKEAVALHFEGALSLPDVLLLSEVKLTNAAPITS